jgi:hypothetical protein
MAENEVVEVSRHDSDNGYVYEYDESLASVKEIQRTQRQRIGWWRVTADADVVAGQEATAA